MKAIHNQFLKLLSGSNQFRVPVFQRDYTWSEEQWKTLWDDILHAGRPEAIGGHFLGSIVYVGDDEPAVFNTFQIIDGQQRLTTLVLLLTALRDHIASTDWSGGDDSPTPAKIHGNCLINRDESDRRLHKLRLRRTDDSTLTRLVDKRPTRNEQVSPLIHGAYEYYRKVLKKSDPDHVYRGVGRLLVVDVSLNRSRDAPQLVFESLNSTGVALSQSDLVRNYLLMGLEEEHQTRLYEDYWRAIEDDFRHAGSTPDRFLREYVALNTETRKALRDHEIYECFKRYWTPPAGEPAEHVEQLEQLLSELVRFADYFLGVVAPRKFSDRRSRPLTEALSHVRALGVAHAMLTMQLSDCHASGSLDESSLLEALNIIESYIIRRSFLGWSSRGYWRVFASVTRFVRADPTKESTIEALKVAFAQQAQRFPTDDEFERAILEVDLYHRRNCHHLLSRLENSKQGEPSPVQDYSVEHIMPQTLGAKWRAMLGDDWEAIHEEWLHRLGNLTLTAYNSEMSNKSFSKKKTTAGGFNDSAVRLNSFVRRQESWTATQIRERGTLLARRALDVWSHHGADEQKLREARLLDLRGRAAAKTSDDLHLRPKLRSLLDNALQRIRELGGILEVIEKKSVCCYLPPEFFVEILPMTKNLRLLLPLDFDDVSVPEGLEVYDATEWSWIQNRVHTECDLIVDVYDDADIARAMVLVRQAFSFAGSD